MRQTSKKCVERIAPPLTHVLILFSFQLANSEQHQAFYALLEIFAYKTYQDYLRTITSSLVFTRCTEPDGDRLKNKRWHCQSSPKHKRQNSSTYLSLVMRCNIE
jgi:hypothetical protein